MDECKAILERIAIAIEKTQEEIEKITKALGV